MSWYDSAVKVIAEVHAKLPPDATDAERIKAVSDAYPFGERAHWPYKMWLKARREYLARWSSKPAGPLAPVPLPPSPLEKAKKRADEFAAMRGQIGAGS